MPRSIQSLTRPLCALAFLGVLTFGAVEAFATPGQARNESARPWCNPTQCNEQCGGYGICDGFRCLCY